MELDLPKRSLCGHCIGVIIKVFSNWILLNSEIRDPTLDCSKPSPFPTSQIKKGVKEAMTPVSKMRPTILERYMREIYNSPNTKELGPKNSGPCLVFPYFMWSTFEPKSKLDPFTFKLGPKLSLRPSVLRLGVSCGIQIKFFEPTRVCMSWVELGLEDF